MSSSTELPNQVVETCCRQEKRARIAGTAVDPNWRDWADLIAGPAGLIAERVLADDVADYLRFRAVCRTWRRCTAPPDAHGTLDRRFHPRRWIMLAQTAGAVRKRRDFLNVSTGERIRVDLPELRYQYVFGATSDGGLIVLCDKRTYVVRLLNPLTRQLTTLPAAITWQHNGSSQRRTNKYTLCGNRALVAGLADDSTVFLHMDPCWLFTAKPSDKQWTRLHTGLIITTLPFAGRFYCLTEKALMVADTTATGDPQLAVAAELGDMGSVRYDRTVKLVDNDGELVLIRRIPHDSNNAIRKGYEACKVDLEARIIVTLPMQQGIAGRALFACEGPWGLGHALLLPTRLSPHVHVDTVYSCNRNVDGPPRIGAYRLLYGDARFYSAIKTYRLLSGHRIEGGNSDVSAIEARCLLQGCIGVNIGDARSCSVVESVSHYVCGRKIIAHERRRSERVKLRIQLQHMCALDQSNMGGESQ